MGFAMRLLAATLLAVFVGEFGVMLVVDQWGLSRYAETAADAAALSLLLFPILYWMLYRPLQGRFDSYQATLGQAIPLRQAADQNPAAVVLMDGDGHIEYVNAAFAETTGYSFDEVKGEAMGLFGEFSTEQLLEIHNAVRDGRVWRGEVRNRRKNGEKYWVSASVSGLHDETGRLRSIVKISLDITQLKTQAEELRETGDQLRIVTDALPMLVAQLDREWRYQFMNRAYEEWFGLRREEWLGKHLYDLIGQEAFERVRPFTERALAGETVTTESEITHPNGRRRAVEALFMPVRTGTAGPVEAYIGIVTDVTERRKMEQALKAANEELEKRVAERTNELVELNKILQTELAERQRINQQIRESEARYRTMFEIAPDGVLVVDPATALPLEFNETTARQLGYTREEFASVPIPGYEVIERPEDTKAHIEKIMREGFDRFETVHRTKQGERRNVLVTVQSLVLGGRPVFYCIFRDITGMKQIEQRLRENEAALRALFNAINETLFMMDTNGVLIAINETGARRMNTTPEALAGKDVMAMLPPELAKERWARFHEVNSTGQAVHFTDSRAGIVFDQVIYPVKDANGAVTSYVTFAMDITAKKEAEEKLERAMKDLEETNRELREFVYIASHDLQEPLRKVAGFGDRLRTHLGGALDEKGRDYLERMTGAAQRMSQLIEDLLLLSRVTSQAKPFEEVDLNDVLTGVREDMELAIAESGAAIEVEDLPVVQADRTQMRQLLQNLLGNALKFRRPGVPCRIGITGGENLLAAKMGGRIWGPGTLAVITVADNGIGFEQKYAERIFGVFQRLHGRGEYKGTGVGLAICKKIVDRHGGWIEAAGTQGGGSSFTITLPRRQSI